MKSLRLIFKTSPTNFKQDNIHKPCFVRDVMFLVPGRQVIGTIKKIGIRRKNKNFAKKIGKKMYVYLIIINTLKTLKLTHKCIKNCIHH